MRRYAELKSRAAPTTQTIGSATRKPKHQYVQGVLRATMAQAAQEPAAGAAASSHPE